LRRTEITGIDMYMGSGGAPEGVLAAAALKCMGGQIWGKLLFRNDDERARARKAGITNFDRVYSRDDLVRADVIFSATGVTNGSLVAGSSASRLGHDRDHPDALEDRLGPPDDLQVAAAMMHHP
jgi:fructose-1,6-bisphosphatase/sedoheptulose 1,7-bisphosphatase-like protein